MKPIQIRSDHAQLEKDVNEAFRRKNDAQEAYEYVEREQASARAHEEYQFQNLLKNPVFQQWLRRQFEASQKETP